MKAKNQQKKLQRRIDDYVKMMSTSKAPTGAYHCPGSNKK